MTVTIAASFETDYDSKTNKYTHRPEALGTIYIEVSKDHDISKYPKFVGMRKGWYKTVRFYSDGVNKGINETGLKRVRKIFEIEGDAVVYEKRYLNSYNNLDELKAVLAKM